MRDTDNENGWQPFEERIYRLEMEVENMRDAVAGIRVLLWGLVVFATIAFIMLSVSVISLAHVIP